MTELDYLSLTFIDLLPSFMSLSENLSVPEVLLSFGAEVTWLKQDGLPGNSSHKAWLGIIFTLPESNNYKKQRLYKLDLLLVLHSLFGNKIVPQAHMIKEN